jgi:AcrR family transcriptional regulator
VSGTPRIALVGAETAPPKRLSLRTRQKALTRQLLWDAAVGLFVAKGYAATTIDDITSSAGVSRATFYLHFDGKARLAALAYDEVLMPETLSFYRRLDTLGDPAQVRGWLDDALSFCERHHDLLSFAEEAVSLEPTLHDYRMSRLLDRCVEAMPRFRERWSGPERAKAHLRLELLIAQLTSFADLWVKGHWPVERETALDVLIDPWVRALLPGTSSGLSE